MGIENNVEMVGSMLESRRNENIVVNVVVELDNDGVSEAQEQMPPTTEHANYKQLKKATK
ncbi:hypothetical protein MTR_7g107700 [Medicago truncatula]|uniref:Uncharacterized protein n=1 Tax=Medicago truncatula TaxID=3880 RepID=A0A072U5H7_MEDTR|nr:hypothetical protein MTR_7g107700 [Medicago truncatula]